MLKAVGVAASPILPADYTVDTLPDAAQNLDKYARVSDLFGAKRDLVLASQVGAIAFWQPVRPMYAAKQAVSADIIATPLKTPSVLLLEGSVAVGATRQISLSNNYAFPGASFRLKQRTGLGTILGLLQVINVNLGTPVSILTGNTVEFVFDMVDGWVQVT